MSLIANRLRSEGLSASAIYFYRPRRSELTVGFEPVQQALSTTLKEWTIDQGSLSKVRTSCPPSPRVALSDPRHLDLAEFHFEPQATVSGA